jgi:hypothetical protein
MNLHKVANVFDWMASYVDAVEGEKLAAAESMRQARVDKVASAHVTAHGEDIPEEIRRKLSSTDPSVLAYVENLLQKQAETVEPLGNPVNQDNNDPPNTKRASDDAHERFGQWILS